MRRSLVLVSLIAAAACAVLWLALPRAPERAALDARAPEHSAPQVEPTALEPAPAELTREPVALEASEPTDSRSAAVPPDEGASLLVRVVASPSGEAVRRARVQVTWSDEGARLPLGGEAEETPEQPMEARAETDWRGRAEVAVPAGAALRVAIEGPTQAVWNPELQHGSWTGAVEALARGERRALECSIPRGRDLVFWLRVVDDAQVPIAGARIDDAQDARVVETEGGGLARFDCPSWRLPLLEVTAEGFAPARLRAEPGHASPAEARELVLARSAELEAHFVLPPQLAQPAPLTLIVTTLKLELGSASRGGRSSAPADAGWLGTRVDGFRLSGDVRARIEGNARTPMVRAELDASGAALATGLVPGLRYFASLARQNEIVWQHPDALVFEPGERKEARWTVVAGVRVAGRVLDPRGIACDLWLLRDPSGAEDGRGRALVYLDGGFEHHERTTCAADGSFAFEDVQPGRWVVAPAPSALLLEFDGRRLGVVAASPDARGEAVARIGLCFEVRSEGDAAALELPLFRAPAIRGRVLRRDGSPVAGAEIAAQSEAVRAWLATRTDEEGRFELGPLHPSRHELRAFSAHGDEAGAAQAAQPGDEVELRLDD